MKADDGAHSLNHRQYLSDIAKRGDKRSARFDVPEETSFGSASNNGTVKSNDDYIEITLDVSEDYVAVHSFKMAGPSNVVHSEFSQMAKQLSHGSSEGRNSSMKIRQLSQELMRLDSIEEEGPEFTFINKTFGLDDVKKKFGELTINRDGWLPRERFGECLDLFDVLVRRKNITEKTHVTSNSIDEEGLDEFWKRITDTNFGSRLQIFFDMVDKDADGRLSKEEVREIIRLSASANKLLNIHKKADEYAALIMEELDPDDSGYILIEHLERLLSHATAQPKRGDVTKELSQMLSRNLDTKNKHVVSKTYDETKYFVLDYRQRLWMLTLWIGIMTGLFAYKYVQYKNKAVYEVMGVCVCLAKGAAETLMLCLVGVNEMEENGMKFELVFTFCRNTITWLRNKTRLGSVVPFDDNIKFYQIIAVGIVIGVGIHGMAHLTCDFPRLLHADEEKYKPMEPFFGKDQPPNYWWFVKGVEGITGIIMVVLMAIAFTLASPWLRNGKLNLPKFLKKLTGFNAFWYSHHLFVIVYAMLIVHGIKLYLSHEWYKKTTWMYVAVPIILYSCVRLIRAFRSSIKDVQIKEVAIYSDRVLALHVFKPPGFKYKSGQYMFINCAAVSPFEWHPFSITSSPNDDYLSVHIRNLGDWTKEIQEVFSKVCQSSPTGMSGVLKADFIRGEDNAAIVPEVLIDGPYGAPAQDYKKYEVVLLIGLGIGATPMISIVKDIAYNIKAKEEEVNAIENGFGTASDIGLNSTSGFITRKAYFYWVAPSQVSFKWFKEVINEVTDVDKNGVIEIHNHCSSVYEEGNAQSALISMLQSINYAKHGIDIVADTHVKSHFAKPDWRKVYKSIAVKHPNSQIGVFYCGNPSPVKELKKLAADFSHNTSTTFDFHKENF